MSVCFEQVQVRQSVGGRGCHGESTFGFVCQVFKEALSQGVGGEPVTNESCSSQISLCRQAGGVEGRR